MREAYCYISIEIDGDLVSETPLAEMSTVLRKAADKIASFEEDQNLNKSIPLRIGRKKIGHADLDVMEQDDKAIDGAPLT
ncbi:hypothetical protein LCGC14_1457760 [marine sediment metagenome]|uniref:Uncharacterized protein n=1 Tax=marine sediment metagenome TaxID=412755 RepID=A0A0F9JGM8_9ZZZZ